MTSSLPGRSWRSRIGGGGVGRRAIAVSVAALLFALLVEVGSVAALVLGEPGFAAAVALLAMQRLAVVVDLDDLDDLVVAWALLALADRRGGDRRKALD